MSSWQEYEQFYAAKTGQDPSAMGWEHKAFDEIRDKLREEKNFIENPITVEEGVFCCKKCKSFKTYSYSKQVRSSDEGFSTFITCCECWTQWREN